MIDANNLYGGIMEKFPLPLHDFEMFDKSEWTDEEAQEILRRILNTPDDDEVGYIVEVDFSYPDSLHDLHSDFPLAPTKKRLMNAGSVSIKAACWPTCKLKNPRR